MTEHPAIVELNLRTFAQYWHPFRETVWVKCQTPITAGEVFTCLIEGDLLGPGVPKPMDMDFWDLSERHDHARRIAWFVAHYNDITEPISVDFGIPGTLAKLQVDDGNHRLAAALYLDKATIRCEWSGAVSRLEHFIGPFQARPEVDFVSRHCQGEICNCGQAATHKIEEVIFADDPYPTRHPPMRYVCQVHFDKALRPHLFRHPDSNEYKPV